MEETVTGIKVRGRWKEVVEKTEEATETLREEAEEDDVEEFDEWRPREDEDLDGEVRDRTVEKAVVRPNSHEEEGKGPVEGAGKAVGEAEQAVEEAVDGNIEDAAEESRNALYDAVISLDGLVRKLFRGLEYLVYTHLMARTGPQYFDSELVSASIDRKGGRRTDEDEEFEVTINVNDDEVQDSFKQEMVDDS